MIRGTGPAADPRTAETDGTNGRRRDVAEAALALAGVVVVLGAVISVAPSPWHVGVVVAGLLLLEIGFWGLAGPVLPDERTCLPLRREVERFLGEVRRLNDHAVAGERDEMERTRERLHRRVDAIFEAAGDGRGGSTDEAVD